MKMTDTTMTFADITSIEEITAMLRNEAEFTTFFNKKAVQQELGKGHWKFDEKRGFVLTFPDGSYVRMKFFDTVKKIFNTKNVEVVGRDSFLSYVDIVVMPAGAKGYGFKLWITQHVKAPKPGARKAADLHAESIAALKKKAEAFGIDLNDPDVWDRYYQRFI